MVESHIIFGVFGGVEHDYGIIMTIRGHIELSEVKLKVKCEILVVWQTHEEFEGCQTETTIIVTTQRRRKDKAGKPPHCTVNPWWQKPKAVQANKDGRTTKKKK